MRATRMYAERCKIVFLPDSFPSIVTSSTPIDSSSICFCAVVGEHVLTIHSEISTIQNLLLCYT